MSSQAMRAIAERLSLFKFVPVDLVDDAEMLATVPPESLDFLIANHVLEHCRDPIGTLQVWLRALRPNGILFLTVPDRSNMYDRSRPLTTIAHLRRDYLDGPGWSQQEHYEEYARLSWGASEQEVPRISRQLMETHYSIHQHVWDAESFRSMLDVCRTEFGFSMTVVEVQPSVQEFLVVVRKRTQD